MSGRATLLTALTAVIVLVSGCSPGPERRPAESSPASSTSTNWKVRQGSLADSSISQMRNGWKADWANHVTPFEANASSTNLVAVVESDAFSGVAVVDARTGEVIKQVDRFVNGEGIQVGGQANEDFAVWKEYRTFGSLDDYVVKEWDRKQQEVLQIGESRRNPEGVTYPSTWQSPVIAAGNAAWVEASDDQGGGDLVVADLSTGKRHVVPRAAHPGRLSTFGTTLIWAESPTRGAPTQLHAIDIRTHEPVELPEWLKGIRGAGFLVTDGKSAAWVRINDVGVSLMVRRSSDAKPVEVKTFTDNGFSPPFSIASNVIAVSISSGGLLLLDLQSGRFAIQEDASYAVAAGGSLLVAPFVVVENKADPPPLPFAQISIDDATKILVADK